MKKLSLFFVLLTVVLYSFCIAQQYETGRHMRYGISAADMAMGGTGASNIWHSSPLSMQSNPAKLGYARGVGYGWTQYKANGFSMGEELTVSSSYVALGYEGIGLLLPMVNRCGRFGSSYAYDFRYQGMNDEDFEQHGMARSSSIGLGCNIWEAYNHFNGKTQHRNFPFDISLGLTYSFQKTFAVWGPDADYVYYSTDDIKNNKTLDFGYLFVFHPLEIISNKDICNNLGLSLIAGQVYGNVFKVEYSSGHPNQWIDGEQDFMLPSGLKTSYSGIFTLQTNAVKSSAKDMSESTYDIVSTLYPSLLSFGFSYGEADWHQKPDRYHLGYELTFFGIWSLRRGEISGSSNPYKGTTKGWGININLWKYGVFQYNKAKYYQRIKYDENTYSNQLRTSKEDFTIIIYPVKIWEDLQ